MKRGEAPGEIFVFDVETTGVDIEVDRILTCYAMVRTIDGETAWDRSWTIDPGVEVPPGASDVHGMTTDWIREHGRKDAHRAIHEIEHEISRAAGRGLPIVGFNHSFDLGILDREMCRHLGYGLAATAASPRMGTLFLDPLVIDRALDKYRKGGRKLFQVAAHYGIEVDELRLHDAKYDVELTAKIAWRIMQKMPMNLKDAQAFQAEAKREWAEHLTEYFAGQGKTEPDGSPIVVDGNFPWRRRDGEGFWRLGLDTVPGRWQA